MVTEWYRKYLGTKYEGGDMPCLYHHYVRHDDNRDWYMLTQIETKNVNQAVYHEWFPQFWLDEHQMGYYGPRIYIPPNADPVAKMVNPLVHRGNNLVGADMGWRFEEAGKSGVIYNYSFDAYWPGGTRNTGWWKNMYGMLTEIASARIATPMQIAPTELQGGTKGLIEYQQQINFPNPWPGGTWRLRDIMDYELIVSDAALETMSKFRRELLRGVANMAGEAVRSADADRILAHSTGRPARSGRCYSARCPDAGTWRRSLQLSGTRSPFSFPLPSPTAVLSKRCLAFSAIPKSILHPIAAFLNLTT